MRVLSIYLAVIGMLDTIQQKFQLIIRCGARHCEYEYLRGRLDTVSMQAEKTGLVLPEADENDLQTATDIRQSGWLAQLSLLCSLSALELSCLSKR